MRTRAITAAIAAVTCAVALSACGQTSSTSFADNEGLYVNVGPLQYQVELSRQLNPWDVEDRNYVAGVPTKKSFLTPEQQWFGVFMLVVNKTNQTQFPADEYYITDTEDNVYRPTSITGPNPFAYRVISIPANSQLPLPGSPAATGPAGGAEVLFKLPYSADDNRPLDLHIVNSADPSERAVVVLDV